MQTNFLISQKNHRLSYYEVNVMFGKPYKTPSYNQHHYYNIFRQNTYTSTSQHLPIIRPSLFYLIPRKWNKKRYQLVYDCGL